MQTSSFPCGKQAHYPQHEFQSHAPVVARSGRNVMRRQRLEELQPARILPSTCSRPRMDMRARVAEDTRVEAVIPVLPPNNVTSSSMDYDSLFGSTCALGGVEQAMRATGRGILTASPKESLDSVIPRLSKVTGLPVLNLDGRVVGVISRKDIIRVRKGERPGSLQDPVEKHMTTPAITIARTASVQEAADLMLSKRIRRLPVVDDSGFPVGILSRSDIFTPLFTEGYTQFMDREAAEVQGLTVPAGAPAVQVVKKKKVTWAVKYLYDGDCAMCLSLKAVLSRQDKHKKIKYVNIASDDYNPSKNMGIEYEEAMKTIHVIRSDGEVLYGTEALRAMFNEVGLGWAANLSEWPLLNWLVDIIYNFLSANRISLGGAMDAIIAAKRVEMSKEGVESCGDLDEECKVEW